MPIRPSVLIGKQIAELLDPSKAGDGYFYLKGDANTDGSWRVMVVNNKIMSFQFREAGTWSIKLAINADDSKNYIQKTEDINSYINMDELRTALAINDEGAMDGRTPVLRATDSEIQWQYEGESSWRTLIDIANYIPEVRDGVTPQLRVSGTLLQSSDDGANWEQLFDLDTLRPDDGRSAEFRMNGSFVQWQLQRDQSWINLFDTEPLKGNDGKSVSLRNNAGVIQQSQDGQVWTDLFTVPRDGEPGPKNNITIGTVTTVANSASAAVSLTGESPNQVLNFSIPAGKDAVNLNIGIGTVTSLSSGSQATASLSGIFPNLTLNLGIPAGLPGSSPLPTQFSIGTVSLAPYGSAPSVSVAGNAPNQSLSFVIPSGKDGDNAIQPTFKVGTVSSGSSPAVTVSTSGATNTLNFTLQKGDNGVGVSASVVTYQASTSGTLTPAGTWLSAIPSVAKGQYLWTRTVTSFSDGTSTTAYSVAYHAVDGTMTSAYQPQGFISRAISPATAYQHTDLTKPFKVIVNARSTQSVILGNLSPIDKVELRVGPTAASVAPGGTGGSSIGVWETGITGLSLMVGASIQDGGQMSGEVQPGWFFRVNVLSGTSATIVSCFTQSLTP